MTSKQKLTGIAALPNGVTWDLPINGAWDGLMVKYGRGGDSIKRTAGGDLLSLIENIYYNAPKNDVDGKTIDGMEEAPKYIADIIQKLSPGKLASDTGVKRLKSIKEVAVKLADNRNMPAIEKILLATEKKLAEDLAIKMPALATVMPEPVLAKQHSAEL